MHDRRTTPFNITARDQHRAFSPVTVGLILTFLWLPGSAQVVGIPSAEEVLRRVEEQMSGVNDYTVTLHVTVDLQGLNVQPMTVTMFFKQPDKVHFAAEQFALLPREGLSMSIGQLRSRFIGENVESDTLGGKQVWRLTMKSRADRTGSREIRVLVDPDRWTIERLGSTLPDGRRMSASFSYEQIEVFLLPSTLEVRFASQSPDTTRYSPLFEEAPSQRTRRAPPTGRVLIRYSDYQLNQGLNDEIFSTPVNSRN